jgi:capsular polysaccharide biosynthesis protein
MMRRQAIPLALAIIAGTLLGGAAMAVAPREYTAWASVFVTPTGVGVNNPARNRAPAGVDLDTESKLVVSAGVVDAVERQLPGEKDLVERVHIQVPPNSAVLVMKFRSRSPARAARGANAFAAAYLEDRRQRAVTELEAAVVRRRTQLAALEQELRRESQRPRATAAEEAVSTARTQVLTRQISALSADTTELASTTVTPGRLLRHAVPPTRPSSPIPVVWVVSGLAVGILAGVAIAQLRERTYRQVHRREDIPRLLGVRVLAALPESVDVGVLGTGDVGHAAAEIVALAPPPRRLVLVAGVRPGEAGVAAVQLAAALGREGFRTLAVLPSAADAPLAELLDAPAAGLADVVLARHTLTESSRSLPGVVADTRVMGPGTPEAEADLGHTSARARFAALRQRVDYLVVATTPTAEAIGIGADAHVAVVTVLLRHTRLSGVRATLRRIREVPVAGVLLAPRGGTRVAAARPARAPAEPASTR